MFSRKAVIGSLIAALMLLVSSVLAGSGTVAAASPDSPEAVAREAAAAGVKRVGFFVFEKNAKNPTNSRLLWQEWITIGDRAPRKTVELSWRAGSGMGFGPDATDSCVPFKGWLPNGQYAGTFKTGFVGDINGIVWELDPKDCRRTKKERNALFIHSEMMPDGKQNPNIESQRWDGRGDYVSEGCVKLKPADIREAAVRYRAFYGASADNKKNKLLVVTGG